MKDINVYIASKFGNRLLIKILSNHLEKKYPGIKIKSSWITRRNNESFLHDVKKDFEEVKSSDFVIGVYPWGDGTKCEISYAVGLNKPVIALIDNVTLSSLLCIEASAYSEFFPLANFMYDFVKDKPFVISSNIDEFYSNIEKVINFLRKDE